MRRNCYRVPLLSATVLTPVRGADSICFHPRSPKATDRGLPKLDEIPVRPGPPADFILVFHPVLNWGEFGKRDRQVLLNGFTGGVHPDQGSLHRPSCKSKGT